MGGQCDIFIAELTVPRAPLLCSVSASGDRTVRLWSAETGQSLAIFGGHSRGIASLDFDGPSSFVRPSLPAAADPRSGMHAQAARSSRARATRCYALSTSRLPRTYLAPCSVCPRARHAASGSTTRDVLVGPCNACLLGDS